MCRSLVLLLLLVAMSPAHAEAVRPPACGAHSKRVVRTLADVDWCNFDYGMRVILTDGHGSLHLYARRGQAHDTIAHTLHGAVYDRTRHTAALVLQRTTITNAGASRSTSTTIHVYKLARGKPVHAGYLDVDAPVHAITFEKHGVIAVSAGDRKAITRFARSGDEYVEVAARP